MKKAISLLAALSMLLGCTACGGSDSKPADTTAAPKTSDTTKPADTGKKETIKLYSFTDEVPNMVKKYIETHPDFAAKFEVKETIVPTTDGAYQPALDQALQSDNVDMFCAEAAFVKKYTQGDGAKYAAPFEDLGITDVAGKISSAKIAQYTVDIGSNPDGKVVGLGYQATGGAFIYRRSLAQATFGTDDPKTIKTEIGPGWDQFWKAAEKLKAKGYGIVSGDGDIWHAVENSSATGWLNADGKLVIDPKREDFFNMSKKLKDNGWHNDTQDWTHAWYADMRDYGGSAEVDQEDGSKKTVSDSEIKTDDTKQIFGYFGPAWLINYVIKGQVNGTNKGEGTFGDWAICESPVGFFWGGTWVLGTKSASDAVKPGVAELIEWITLDTTEDGLQYKWANGTLNGEGGTKDSVASGVVMEKSDGKLDLLDGQNMFDVFVPANSNASGKTLTQYDESINSIWRDQVRMYTSGQKTKEKAIADFKQKVKDDLDIQPAE